MKLSQRSLFLCAAAAISACSGATAEPDMIAVPDASRIVAVDLAMQPPPPDLAGIDFAGADFAGVDMTIVTPPDLVTTPDLAAPYVVATINKIDTDPGNGPFGNARLVTIEKVIAVTDVDKYVNSANQQCRYQIWVQDPACVVPPCGMVVKAIGPKAPSPNSTGKDCPAARISGTVLANIGRGDNVKVSGKVVFEVDSVAPNTVIEHQIFADSVTPLQNVATINPLVISDATVYAQLVAHMGTTWNKYEGMSVTLQPAKGTLQISATSGSGFKTIPGNTDWGNTFDSSYIPNGQMTFPTLGSVWKSISGVVSTRHGGEVMPVRFKDFVP